MKFGLRTPENHPEKVPPPLKFIIIIIMWLVQRWTLPFLRAYSMPVDSALGDRRLLAVASLKIGRRKCAKSSITQPQIIQVLQILYMYTYLKHMTPEVL